MLCDCCALASSSLLFGFFRFLFLVPFGWLVCWSVDLFHAYVHMCICAELSLALACSAERNISENREREVGGRACAKVLLRAASISAFVAKNDMIG